MFEIVEIAALRKGYLEDIFNFTSIQILSWSQHWISWATHHGIQAYENISRVGKVLVPWLHSQKRKSKTSVRPSEGSRLKLKSVRGGSSDKNGSLLLKAESASKKQKKNTQAVRIQNHNNALKRNPCYSKDQIQ